MSKNLREVLKEGLQNEFNGAVNYAFLASKTGDVSMRKKMLIYSMDEMNHAYKIMGLLEKLGESIGDVSPELVNMDDILEFLVLYKAKEESSIFYYDVLIKLLDNEKEREIFTKIKQEEEEHFNYINDLITQIK